MVLFMGMFYDDLDGFGDDVFSVLIFQSGNKKWYILEYVSQFDVETVIKC